MGRLEQGATVGARGASDIPLIAGDVVHNLRSALDHIVYYLVQLCTGGTGPVKNLYFPMGKDRADFEKRLAEAQYCKTQTQGIVKRLRDDAVDAIKALQPYQGGFAEGFWHVHQLEIIDKHHLLLTVGSLNRRQSMSPSEISSIMAKFKIDISVVSPELAPKVFLKESAYIPEFPLKAGYALAVVLATDAQQEMHFPIEIAFGQPEIVKGRPVLETLYKIADMIHHTIMAFDSAGVLD